MSKSVQLGPHPSLIGSGGSATAQPTRGTAMAHSSSRAVASAVSLMEGDRPSLVTGFSLVGDGVTDDTTAFQNALNSVAGSGNAAWLEIPSGYIFAVNQLSIPSNVTLIGQNAGSLIKFIGSPSAGFGRIDVPLGTTNWGLENFSIDGGVTSPVGIDYASITSPIQASLSTGTSIWIHGGAGASGCLIERLGITHTGGYAVLLDATAGSMAGYKIRRCKLFDNRPHTFGVSGSFIYGGWTSSIHYESDGTLYTIDDFLVELNSFLRMSGHCFWGHGGALNLLNTNIRFNNNFAQDHALDMCEIGVTDGFSVQGNHSVRGGYLSLTDSAVGTPMQGTVSPAIIDHTGKCINGIISGNLIECANGTAIDGDGLGKSTVSNNNCSSAWVSQDPNADPTHCGTLRNGVNLASGFNLGNSNQDPDAATLITFTGNLFKGFAAGSGRFYAGRNYKAQGNVVHAPCNSTVSPFQMGPVGNGPFQRNYSGDISGNTVYWNPGALVASGLASATFNSATVSYVSGTNFPTWAVGSSLIIGGVEYLVASNSSTVATLATVYKGITSGSVSFGYFSPSGGAAIAEDGSISAYTSTEVNFVRDNTLISVPPGNLYQFSKALTSSSTTGEKRLSSVSPSVSPTSVSQPDAEYVLQTEHYAAGAVDLQLKLYKNIPYGVRVASTPYKIGQSILHGTPANIWTCTVAGTTSSLVGGPLFVPPNNYTDGGVNWQWAGLYQSNNNVATFTDVTAVFPAVSMGTFSLSPTAPIESHRLIVQADGALNDRDNKSPATFLLGSTATSMRVVENHIYPYPTTGVESREAALMLGVIVPAGTTNWETDGLVCSVVSQCPTSGGGGVVAGSFFAVAAATGATVWTQNWRVLDYDNFNESTSFSATLIGLELDVAVANTGSQATGLNMGIYLPKDRRTYANSFGAINVNTTGGYPGATTGWLFYNYWNNGLTLGDGSCDVGILVGLAPISIGVNSQFINFRSGSGASHLGKIYAASDGTMIIFPNTETASTPLAIFGNGNISGGSFTAVGGTTGASLSVNPIPFIGLLHGYTIGQQITDKNGNVQEVTQAGTGPHDETLIAWGSTLGAVTSVGSPVVKFTCLLPPVIVDNSRNVTVNSLTIRSPFVAGSSVLAIDNTNTANFSQIKVLNTVVIDGGLNCGFALATFVGLQVGLPTGGAPVGYVNTTNGYKVNGNAFIDSGLNLSCNGATVSGTLNCTTLVTTTFSGSIINAFTAFQIAGFNVYDSSRNSYQNSVSIGLYGSSTVVINSSQQAFLSALQVGTGGATFTGNASFIGSGFSISATNTNSGTYYCNSTQVMDGSRNLTNINNIGVGTVTCTNNIQTTSGRFVAQGNPGGTTSWVDSAGKTITMVGGLFISRV